MLKNKITILIIGTVSSYIGLFLIPSVLFFPLPFAILFLSSSKYLGDFKKALFIVAIFSLPYSWGKSLLYLDSDALFVITAFVGIIFFLTALSIKEKAINKFYFHELFLILFLTWGVITFIFPYTYPEVLDGIFKISTTVLFMFLAKVYLRNKRLKEVIVFILISILVFESSLIILQFFLGQPIGLFIEEGIQRFPYGRVSTEDITLYRPSGSMFEPTWIARFLTMLLPFILMKVKSVIPIRKATRILISVIALLSIFFTFTRVSWVVAALILVLIYIWKRPKFEFSRLNKPIYVLLLIIFYILGFITLFPHFEQRISTSTLSFEQGGSFDTRIKLIEEAVSLIEQNPIFGVGLNRFIPAAIEDNVTGMFQRQMVQVHNVFLLIASEMGIPALIFFLAFIIFCYKEYLINRKKMRNKDDRLLKDAAALGGIAYLLESQMGTIFLSPHLSLFMLYMAIISL